MIHLLEAEILQKWILTEEVSVIDVREHSEYNECNIDGSVLIPLATLTIDKVREIAKFGKKIVFHCRSGSRSLRACQMLMEYDNNLDVYNLEGGITAWNALKGMQGKSCSIGGGCASGGCNS